MAIIMYSSSLLEARSRQVLMEVFSSVVWYHFMIGFSFNFPTVAYLKGFVKKLASVGLITQGLNHNKDYHYSYWFRSIFD